MIGDKERFSKADENDGIKANSKSPSKRDGNLIDTRNRPTGIERQIFLTQPYNLTAEETLQTRSRVANLARLRNPLSRQIEPASRFTDQYE